MSFYFVPTTYSVVLSDWHLFFCFWARTIVGISGAVFVLWMIDVICSKIAFIRSFAVFGTTTLGVYVMHEWPLVQLRESAQISEVIPCPLKWPLALAILLFCHFLTMFIRGHRRICFVFFGNERWLSELIDSYVKKCHNQPEV